MEDIVIIEQMKKVRTMGGLESGGCNSAQLSSMDWTGQRALLQLSSTDKQRFGREGEGRGQLQRRTGRVWTGTISLLQVYSITLFYGYKIFHKPEF